MTVEASDDTDTTGRPEQTFFEDPALDRAFGVVMSLATEVYVLRDRLRAMERLLNEKGVLASDELDREPTPEEIFANEVDRREFTAGLLEHLHARQVSKGAI